MLCLVDNKNLWYPLAFNDHEIELLLAMHRNHSLGVGAFLDKVFDNCFINGFACSATLKEVRIPNTSFDSQVGLFSNGIKFAARTLSIRNVVVVSSLLSISCLFNASMAIFKIFHHSLSFAFGNQ